MADFRPETNIYLFEGTGVDDENQPYFTSQGTKMAWYQAHPMISFTAQSYQRENRNYCRVASKAETLRHSDMMAFQNGDGKWVLCRINAVEFVNPNCCDVEYSVDYMQTYIENITFGKCWVEREMQDDDWEGTKPSWNNLQPEGLETGALRRLPVPGNKENLDLMPNAATFDMVILSAYDQSGQPNVRIRSISNIPSGLNAIKFTWPQDQVEINTMLSKYSDLGITDGIAGIFLGPVGWMAEGLQPFKVASLTPTWNVIDGYELINAKCFSSEFCHFELENGLGNSVEWRPEEFTETDNILIIIEGGFSPGGGGAIAYPQRYGTNPRSHGVVIPFDMQCAYVTNAFANWLAQNKASIATDIASAVQRGAVAGLVSGNPAIGAGSAIISALPAIAKIMDRAADPLAIGGQSAGNGLNYTIQNVKFTPSLVCPYLPNLKAIDEFFSKFGYRTNKYKVPNVNTRPKWNYVKTAGAVCRGWFPKSAQVEMERLMNQGVTFWHLSPGEEISDDWDPRENKQ